MLFAVFSFRSNRAFSFPQLKKRKLEIESSTTSMSTIAKVYPKSQDMNEQRDEKRRRKPSDEIKDVDSQKQIVLPQKKRVLPVSSCGSPAKKNQKLTSSQDENAADETLIRETEAALKSLSGSWPGPRGSSYAKQEESPAFENLFDEKKAVKLSPSSTSNSSTDNTCSLKDVITLRDQHDDAEKDVQYRMKMIKIKQENDTETIKSDDDCMQTKPKKQFLKGNIEPSRYDPPDFNELVDDSSNELEIDMSEAASDKNDSSDEKSENKLKTRESEDSRSSRYSKEESNQSTYHPFTRPPVSSPFSTTSAFRPPQASKTNTLTPLGPYPAEATFVGYPSGLPTPLPVEDKSKIPKSEEQDSSTLLTNIKSSVGSPEGVNKQYTILQPAGLGSRAASALQEAAREGVPTVSAVSSSTSSVSTPKMTVATAALSPGSIGRGMFFFLIILINTFN